VLTIIRESVGFAEYGVAHDTEYNDLENLAGTWIKEDYREFKNPLDGQRKIDSELWQ
jgi:hypothetical protein